MEHLINHLGNDLGATLQREHAVIPEVVAKRLADVDEVKLNDLTAHNDFFPLTGEELETAEDRPRLTV